MKTAATWISVILFTVVIVAAMRAVSEKRWYPFRKFDDTTRRAYAVLALVALVILVWARLDLTIESLDIAGVKVTVTKLQKRVDTMSELYKRRKIELFGPENWSSVRVVRRNPYVLKLSLEREPIPESVEVYEGVLPMPPEEFKIEGATCDFPRIRKSQTWA